MAHFWVGVSKKNTLCMFVKMLKIMDDSLKFQVNLWGCSGQLAIQSISW